MNLRPPTPMLKSTPKKEPTLEPQLYKEAQRTSYYRCGGAACTVCKEVHESTSYHWPSTAYQENYPHESNASHICGSCWPEVKDTLESVYQGFKKEEKKYFFFEVYLFNSLEKIAYKRYKEERDEQAYNDKIKTRREKLINTSRR